MVKGGFQVVGPGERGSINQGLEGSRTSPVGEISGQFERILSGNIAIPEVHPAGISSGHVSRESHVVSRPPGWFLVTVRDYLSHPVPARESSTTQEALSIAKKEAKSGPEWTKAIPKTIHDAMEWAGQKYQVPKKLIASIIHTESAFNPDARSRAGAMGLMQLMPGTARDLGVSNPFDIRQNIEAGVRYFRQLLDQFGQDKRLALAAYNAGPGTVQRYGGVPPYSETRDYVSRVLKYFSNEIV